MKHIKKLAALALAIMMLMGLATTAFAADETYDVTIKNAEGHSYKIYQIYTGDLAEMDIDNDGDMDEVLSNVLYGDDYPDTSKRGKEVPLTELENFDPSTFVLPEEQIKNSGDAMTPSGTTAIATGLEAGYYMIVDVTNPLPNGDTRSAVIFQVVDDTDVFSKHNSTPIVEKKIDDTNDSTEATNTIIWHDSADHDIGDAIPFQLKATIPASIGLFREHNQAYPFTFHDTEEKGLAFSKITSVYVMNGDVKTPLDANNYTLVKSVQHGSEHNNEKHTFDVVFSDLTQIDAIQAGSVLIVEYESILTTDAIIGSKGNVNEVYGEYRNYNSPDEPKYTPKDFVIAFTYKVVVNKVDEAGEALAGAEFTLEKYNAATGEWKAIAQVETESDTVFAFEGLDDGNYRLTETETPDGYNTIKPIETAGNSAWTASNAG